VGTWVCHLRIAQNLLARLPDLDEHAFTFGNLAPDSGIPNSDWSKFDPPKEVTHFIHHGESESQIRDLDFFHAHLANQDRRDIPRYSFALGYFFHLLTDGLWAKRIVIPTKQIHAARYAELGKLKMIELIKRDWYGLDHRFLRDGRANLFWRVLMPAPNPPAYLPFIPLNALHQQLGYIRAYYSKPDGDRKLDRAYPFLNEATMTRFVDDTTRALAHIHARLDDLPTLNESTTALAVLDARAIAPFDPPLGDVE